MTTPDELIGARATLEPEPPGQEVTPLELFFDLVLVFGITQVTGSVSHAPTWLHLVEGCAILAAFWWAWVGYAWLANTAASDEGMVRVVLLSAMGALLIASFAVPRAFGADALTFGIAYAIVRLLHIGSYLLLGRDNLRLRSVAWGLATSALPAIALIVVAGFVGGPARGICWGLALAIDYGGLMVRSVEGWEVEPEHFSERHGLIIIIALGESVVSLGVGAQGLPLDARLIVAGLLGMAICGALWWAYFDVAAIVATRRFKALAPYPQAQMARDSYTFLHMPMVAGIVIFAVGLKKTLGHVDADLTSVGAFCLCVGVALYLFALSAFKRRNVGSWNHRRTIVGLVLVAFWPIATLVPALAALAVVALLTCGLIAVEATRMAEARDRIRHAESPIAP
jgi:low temperature requirement protein LtrA